MLCRDGCGVELSPEYVREWFGGRVPVYNPLPPWCPACDERRREASARAERAVELAMSKAPRLPSVRPEPKRRRVCARCNGPGGRSFVSGWCRPCRVAVRAAFDARERGA